MALSRLRNPVISHAPSLIRARLLSSAARSLPRSRALNVLNSIGGIEGTLRNKRSPVGCGLHDYSSKFKWQNGVRYFSSGAPPEQMVIGMPALSPTMNQGNIAKWLKKEGDKIDVGDILCEIETDKATLEFESQEEGFLAKILVPEGSKDVPVGQPIAITVEDADDIKNVSVSATEEVGSQKDITHDKTEEELGSGKTDLSDLPPHIILGMPALSPTMNQGNIAIWRKKEGDKIEVGDILCEIETDKATLEYESLEEGFLAKILVPDGTKDVAVGQPIAVTVEELDDIEIVKKSVGGNVVPKEAKVAPRDTTTETVTQKTSFSRIGPSAKLLIHEHGLEASSITPSGPRGTLLKGDVLAAIKSGKGSTKTSSTKDKTSTPLQTLSQNTSLQSSGLKTDLQQTDASYEDFANSQIRKVIATRLLESKQYTPHLYLSSDVVLDPLLSFRKELKEKFDQKVSVNDIVIKVVAVALRNVPEANAYWDNKKEELVLCDSVDISIAVATEKGLMTPIIRNADQKSISSISLEIKELAEKARGGKLKPNEFQGGTFSISNLGMFPVDRFCAIINPPQAAILAVGRGNQVVEAVIGPDGTEIPGIITKMNLTLSADHRVFDGKVGGAFVAALRSNFSDIQRLLL